MKKFLFPIIPVNITYFPTMSIPTLVSQLRNKSYDVTVMDLNIDFLNSIYTESFLNKSLVKAKEQFQELEKNRESFYKKEDCEQNKFLTLKYDVLNDFFTNHKELGERLPSSIEKAIKILKNKKLFFNPKLLHYAHQVVQYANKLCCLPYFPFDLYRMDIINM